MFSTRDEVIVVIKESETTVMEVFWKTEALYKSQRSKQAFVLNC